MHPAMPGTLAQIEPMFWGCRRAPSAMAHFFDAGVGEGWLAVAHARASGGHGPFGMSREEAIEDLILNGGI
jgi:hypothetical protein